MYGASCYILMNEGKLNTPTRYVHAFNLIYHSASSSQLQQNEMADGNGCRSIPLIELHRCGSDCSLFTVHQFSLGHTHCMPLHVGFSFTSYARVLLCAQMCSFVHTYEVFSAEII